MGKGSMKYLVLFLIGEGAGVGCLLLKHFDRDIWAAVLNGVAYLVFAYVLERYWSERK
jgi:hypothetical protein